MIIESVKLSHFRNYDTLELEFDRKTNLFYGDNAQGKTNILEAIYLCGTTRSHRCSRDGEMIQFSEEEAHIQMQLRKKDIQYRIDMHLKKNKAKGIAINGTAVHRAAELAGIGNFIFFSPEDLSIIKNGPSERRRFMDMELCQLDKIYLRDLSNYNKILAQRNHLLKDYGFTHDAENILDVLDIQLIKYGRVIIGLRRSFTEKLSKIISSVHKNLTGGKEELVLTYESDTDEENFSEKLKQNREKDIRTKITNTGPHRDDLSFSSNGTDIRRYGSQGQQRTAALSLKLSEIEIVRQSINDTPVLLLDDVLSELDCSRQKYLLDNISDVQTFITCTGVNDFVSNNFKIDRLFKVVKGTVSCINFQEDFNGK